MFPITTNFICRLRDSLERFASHVACLLASACPASTSTPALASEHATKKNWIKPWSSSLHPSFCELQRTCCRLLNTLTFTLTLTLRSSLTLLCSVSALHAETLQSSNPFLPPGYGEEEKAPPPPPPKMNGPISRELEFRGLVELNGVLEYSLFHKTEQKGYWLEENQSKNGIQVRGFDRNSKTLTVSMHGRTEQLTLMSPNETPLPVATSINAAGTSRKQPPTLQNSSNNKRDSTNRRRVVPRRRVILPQN